MSFLRAATPWRAAVLLVGMAPALDACSQSDLLMRFTAPQDRAYAQEAVRRLQLCDADYLVAEAAAELKAKTPTLLPRMCPLVPAEAGSTVKLAQVSVLSTSDGSRSLFTYDVEGGNRHAVVRVGVKHVEPDEQVVTDLYVSPLPKSAAAMGAFDLTGKPTASYVVLGLTILAVLVSAVAAILAVATRGVRRRWLWVIGCLIGFGQVGVDWFSGAIHWNLLNVQLLSAYAFKPAVAGTWNVGFAIPVFAILFLIRRPVMRAAARPRRAQLNL